MARRAAAPSKGNSCCPQGIAAPSAGAAALVRARDAALRAATAADLEAAGQGAMWDMLPDGVDAEGNRGFTTADDLTTRATRNDDLSGVVDSCKD